MKSLFPLRHLIILTHLSVFVFTGLFFSFSTYSITKDYFEKNGNDGDLPQISEKASAKTQQDYFVYEKREVIALRPNGLNSERVTGYAITREGEEHIIYSFVDDPFEQKFQKTVPTATILKNGNIFINGVSDLGFAVLDITGNNLTRDYKILRNRQFPLSHIIFKNEKEIVYTYGGINSKEKDSRHSLYWQREGETLQIIDSITFPEGEVFLKPEGWSSREHEVYISRQSHTASFASIWRVNLSTKTVTPLNPLKGALTKGLVLCPEQDYALFIRAPLNPSVGAYGEQIAPSKLMFLNLLTDETREIFSSSELLFDLTVSCASKKLLVKEKDTFLLFDINGKQYPSLRLKSGPLLLGNDGKTVFIQDGTRLLLINIQNGEQHEIGRDSEGASLGKVRYSVLGLNNS